MSIKPTIMLKTLKLTSLLCILIFSGINGNIYAQNNTLLYDSINSKQKTQIEGRVKNAKTGKGISGINVNVEGFSAAITKDDGSFSIKVPNLNCLITVSGQDFQTKVVPLNSKTSGIEIMLSEANYSQFYETSTVSGIEDLQYTNPNASKVVNLKEKQWANAVNQSLGDFLQGRIAGLNSVRNSGVPGAGSYLTLRGFNSLYATNKPLIVVDGMIFDDEDYGSGILQNNTSSPLTAIDVKDIETVTVLKDGASLYGTKGANGVIIITTTQPKDLTTKIDFTMYGGINQAPKALPVMQSSQYRTYLSQLMATRGDSQQQIGDMLWMMDDNRDSADYYQYHNNTNWQDHVFKNSINQNYFLKIRGGDDIAKYGLSLGYLNSEGAIANTGLKRYNTRLNAALRLTKKLTVNANLSFIYNNESQYNQGQAYKTSPIYLALTKSPFIGVNAINNQGEISPNLTDVDIFNVGNPKAIFANGFGVNKNYRFLGSLNFQYDFNNSLKANLIAGLTLNKERESFFIPDFGIADITLPLAIANNRSGTEVQRYYALYTDASLSYNKHFNFIHNFDVKVGLRTQSNESESDLGLGYNSATDDFTTVGAGSNLLRFVGGALGEWNWVNGYASAKYNYANKYFLALNTAYDGSSRFGEDIEFGVLGSVSSAWLVSSEKFMKNVNSIDLLKLRASIGISGNDDIGNYSAQELYVSQNLLGLQGLVKSNIGNPKLKYENVTKFNAGTDLALFNEQLNISFDYFQNKTTDMITYESLSTPSGFDYIISNNASMKTHGFDLGLNSRLVNTPNVQFDLGLNLSRYKNQIINLPNENIITGFGGATYITTEGLDANLFYGLQTNGVYSTTTEATADGLHRRLENGNLIPFSGGDIIFEDTNGDKIIDNKDRKIIGNPNPDFTGSISTNFKYKRLSISGLFNFSVGNDIYNAVRYNIEKMSGYENQSIAINKRWIAEGQQTSIPKAVWGDPIGNASFSDRWIEDGSFFRFKTLTISYDMDVDFNYIKYIKIYASGNNLFTITDYLGYDPEFSATASIFGQGTDTGLMPQFTTIQLGLRLGL